MRTAAVRKRIATATNEATATTREITAMLDQTVGAAAVAWLEEQFEQRYAAGYRRSCFPLPMARVGEAPGAHTERDLAAGGVPSDAANVYMLPCLDAVPEPIFDAVGNASDALCAHLDAAPAREQPLDYPAPGDLARRVAEVAQLNGWLAAPGLGQYTVRGACWSTEFSHYADEEQTRVVRLSDAFANLAAELDRFADAARDAGRLVQRTLGVDPDVHSQDARVRALALRRGRNTGPPAVSTSAARSRRPRNHTPA